MKYAIECGQKLIEKKATLKEELGHGSWKPWLEANEDGLGFKERAAQLMMRHAKTQSTAVLTEAAAVKSSRQLWGNSVKPFREDDEWYTPVRYIDAAREVLGVIDLDPASNAIAQATVKAANWRVTMSQVFVSQVSVTAVMERATASERHELMYEGKLTFELGHTGRHPEAHWRRRTGVSDETVELGHHPRRVMPVIAETTIKA